jgi:hypothetical protein
MATAPAYRREPETVPLAPGPDESRPLTHEEPTAEEIAAEAYAIYIAHGQADGRDIDDWLEAEQSLKARQAQRSTESGR